MLSRSEAKWMIVFLILFAIFNYLILKPILFLFNHKWKILLAIGIIALAVSFWPAIVASAPVLAAAAAISALTIKIGFVVTATAFAATAVTVLGVAAVTVFSFLPEIFRGIKNLFTPRPAVVHVGEAHRPFVEGRNPYQHFSSDLGVVQVPRMEGYERRINQDYHNPRQAAFFEHVDDWRSVVLSPPENLEEIKERCIGKTEAEILEMIRGLDQKNFDEAVDTCAQWLTKDSTRQLDRMEANLKAIIPVEGLGDALKKYAREALQADYMPKPAQYNIPLDKWNDFEVAAKQYQVPYIELLSANERAKVIQKLVVQVEGERMGNGMQL